jgi:hypothetical protein
LSDIINIQATTPVITIAQAGLRGIQGPAGTSVTILGSYATYADLVAAHPTGNNGDGYIVDPYLYV